MPGGMGKEQWRMVADNAVIHKIEGNFGEGGVKVG